MKQIVINKRKAWIAALTAITIGGQITHAMALSSVNPVTGVTNTVNWLFLLAAGIIPGIFLIKGIKAMAEGERYGKDIAGLLVGLGIALAGYTIMSTYGGGGAGI